mgnify:CR=1 FL=1
MPNLPILNGTIPLAVIVMMEAQVLGKPPTTVIYWPDILQAQFPVIKQVLMEGMIFEY